MGDFNQVEYLNQKLGGSDHIPGKEQFSTWKSNLGLTELNYHGQHHTWCNNRSGIDRIYERLDRVYATEDWIHQKPEATVLNLPILISDHSPIVLLTSPLKPKIRTPIKMEAWCLDFKEISNIVSDQWQIPANGSPMYSLAQNRQIRYQLFKWCKEYKKCHNISWEECLDKCSELQTSLPFADGGFVDEQAKIVARGKVELQLQYWQQRAKGKWRAWEDTNSKWFFRKAKRRKRRNEILMLKTT
ncbi:uncharacterized protein LOC125493762 [Beta vulgaris subsp. vulgaris]|uniref:uncharacterized protein LOC125493762 n=1 Tax=Beta vulgaris subsp. vulgaris TaxID=3555 RepID=UPI00203766F0|nr:uncharacterized protein LOC125493762 [Beta vulgaris subsp. vulgaris]